jgi:hypothetical protein
VSVYPSSSSVLVVKLCVVFVSLLDCGFNVGLWLGYFSFFVKMENVFLPLVGFEFHPGNMKNKRGKGNGKSTCREEGQSAHPHTHTHAQHAREVHRQTLEYPTWCSKKLKRSVCALGENIQSVNCILYWLLWAWKCGYTQA